MREVEFGLLHLIIVENLRIMEGNGNEDSQSRQLPKLPTDLIYSEILPRLPPKSISRFKAVSHEWCSQLSEPSFVKRYLARSLEHSRFGIMTFAYNKSTKENHILISSGVDDPESYVVELKDTTSKNIYTIDVDGLSLLCCGDGYNIENLYVINPSTARIMNIPMRFSNERYVNKCYALGFDRSVQEFKILSILISITNSVPKEVCGIFSLGTTNTWRTMDIEFPFDLAHWICRARGSVYINGIVHWILPKLGAGILEGSIVRFNFAEEKFSRLDLPSQNVQPAGNDGVQRRNVLNRYLIDVGGCLAFVCFAKVWQDNSIDIWILTDYRKQVWVKNSLKFPVLWREMGGPIPVCSLSKSMVMFTPRKISVNRIVVLLYDIEKKMFGELKVTLPRLLSSDDIEVNYIKTYAANISSSLGDQMRTI